MSAPKVPKAGAERQRIFLLLPVQPRTANIATEAHGRKPSSRTSCRTLFRIVNSFQNRNDRVVKSVLNKFGAGRLEARNGRPRSLPRNGVFVPSERGASSPGELATAC